MPYLPLTMNTEEAFLLSTLKEFVRSWGSGCQSFLQLECKDNQVWCNFSTKLGAPADPHFVPYLPHPPHHGFHGQAHQHLHPRHKGPAQRARDRARAAAHRATQGKPASAVSAEISSNHSPPPPPPPPPQPTDPAASAGNISSSQTAETQTAVAAESESVLPTEPAAASVEDELCSDSDYGNVSEEIAATKADPAPIPELVPVYCVATLENCPDGVVNSEYGDSIRRFLGSEQHLAQNIASADLKHETCRLLRNNLYVHTVSVVLQVRSARLWESPASYVRKHLGLTNNWTRSNGTIVKLSRIHQK